MQDESIRWASSHGMTNRGDKLRMEASWDRESLNRPRASRRTVVKREKSCRCCRSRNGNSSDRGRRRPGCLCKDKKESVEADSDQDFDSVSGYRPSATEALPVYGVRGFSESIVDGSPCWSSPQNHWTQRYLSPNSQSTPQYAPSSQSGAVNLSGAPSSQSRAVNLSRAPNSQSGAVTLSYAPSSQSRAVNLSVTPSSQSGAVNFSYAPSSQSRAVNLSGAPSSQSRAVNLSRAPSSQSRNVTLSCAPSSQSRAVNLSRAPSSQSGDVTISCAPSSQSRAVNPSRAPNSQSGAVTLSHAPSSQSRAVNLSHAPSSQSRLSYAPSSQSRAVNLSGAPSSQSRNVNLSGAPSSQSGAVNFSHAPSSQSGAVDFSYGPTSQSGAVNFSHAPSWQSGAVNLSHAPSWQSGAVDFSYGPTSQYATSSDSRAINLSGGTKPQSLYTNVRTSQSLSPSPSYVRNSQSLSPSPSYVRTSQSFPEDCQYSTPWGNSRFEVTSGVPTAAMQRGFLQSASESPRREEYLDTSYYSSARSSSPQDSLIAGTTTNEFTSQANLGDIVEVTGESCSLSTEVFSRQNYQKEAATTSPETPRHTAGNNVLRDLASSNSEYLRQEGEVASSESCGADKFLPTPRVDVTQHEDDGYSVVEDRSADVSVTQEHRTVFHRIGTALGSDDLRLMENDGASNEERGGGSYAFASEDLGELRYSKSEVSCVGLLESSCSSNSLRVRSQGLLECVSFEEENIADYDTSRLATVSVSDTQSNNSSPRKYIAPEVSATEQDSEAYIKYCETYEVTQKRPDGMTFSRADTPCLFPASNLVESVGLASSIGSNRSNNSHNASMRRGTVNSFEGLPELSLEESNSTGNYKSCSSVSSGVKEVSRSQMESVSNLNPNTGTSDVEFQHLSSVGSHKGLIGMMENGPTRTGAQHVLASMDSLSLTEGTNVAEYYYTEEDQLFCPTDVSNLGKVSREHWVPMAVRCAIWRRSQLGDDDNVQPLATGRRLVYLEPFAKDFDVTSSSPAIIAAVDDALVALIEMFIQCDVHLRAAGSQSIALIQFSTTYDDNHLRAYLPVTYAKLSELEGSLFLCEPPEDLGEHLRLISECYDCVTRPLVLCNRAHNLNVDYKIMDYQIITMKETGQGDVDRTLLFLLFLNAQITLLLLREFPFSTELTIGDVERISEAEVERLDAAFNDKRNVSRGLTVSVRVGDSVTENEREPFDMSLITLDLNLVELCCNPRTAGPVFLQQAPKGSPVLEQMELWKGNLVISLDSRENQLWPIIERDLC